MLIKDLSSEKFEFDKVVIVKNLTTKKWEIRHKDTIVFDKFITKEEARLWAIKISKKVIEWKK